MGRKHSTEQLAETSENQKIVRETLRSVHEPVLKDIFSEYARLTGTTSKFIPIEKVQIIESHPNTETIVGEYSQKEGIYLYARELSGKPAETVWTLIHEEWHAMSDGGCRVIPDVADDKVVQVGIHGITTYINVRQLSSKELLYAGSLALKINEGLTELLTMRVIDEYQKRTGAHLFGLAETKNKTLVEGTRYAKFVHETQFYISLISTLSGVPASVVETSLTAAYLNNDSILPDELVSELANRHPDLPHLVWKLLEDTSDDADWTRNIIDMIETHNVLSPAERDSIESATEEYFESGKRIIAEAQAPTEQDEAKLFQ